MILLWGRDMFYYMSSADEQWVIRYMTFRCWFNGTSLPSDKAWLPYWELPLDIKTLSGVNLRAK